MRYNKSPTVFGVHIGRFYKIGSPFCGLVMMREVLFLGFI